MRTKPKKATKAQLMLYVAAGVSALTDYFGNQDWIDKINLDNFDYQNYDFCVAGQLFSENGQNPWNYEIQEKMGTTGKWGDICAKAAFELPREFLEHSGWDYSNVVGKNWDLLADCWTKTIKHLKKNRVQVKSIIVCNAKREAQF